MASSRRRASSRTISPVKLGRSKARTSNWTGPRVMLHLLRRRERCPGPDGNERDGSGAEDLLLLCVELVLCQGPRVEQFLELHQVPVRVRFASWRFYLG